MPRKLPWIAQTRTPNGCLRGARKRKQWQQSAFTNLTGVPRNPRELTEEPISKSLIQRYGETPGSSECLGASSRHTSGRRESLDRVAQFEAAQHIHQTAGTKGGAEDHPMFSPAKRAHAIHPPVPQILSQLHVEMEIELVQSPGGDLHGPGSIPSHDEQVRSAD